MSSELATTPPPGPEDRHETGQTPESELLARYHATGDQAAREELVVRFMPFARDLALRYAYSDEPVEDLVQVASVGLLKAIDRFEPGRGTRFTTYAAPTILGELKRHFRDRGWALHVARGLQERALAVSRETERLSQRLGRSPTLREVAGSLGRSVEDVIEAAEAAGNYGAISLDAPAMRDEDGSAPLVEQLGREDDRYELAGDRQAIAATWRELPDMERKVVELRFGGELTQREIGRQVGYSQMHVSRLLRRALGRLESATG